MNESTRTIAAAAHANASSGIGQVLLGSEGYVPERRGTQPGTTEISAMGTAVSSISSLDDAADVGWHVELDLAAGRLRSRSQTS